MVVLAFACTAVGCATSPAEDGVLRVVTTIYPVYDWTNEIIGSETENTEVTLLLDDGTDMHSYQATTADIVTIYNADLFIYVGGESDSWVDDVLASCTNDDLVVINLFDVLDGNLYDEEYVDGMEESDHDHDHSDDEDCTDEDCDHDHSDDEDCTDEDCDHDHSEEESETDEHVWLSLNNAKTCCTAIASALSEINSESKDAYQTNLTAYKASLTELDGKYEMAVSAKNKDTILFADRFPFRYMTEDYGLEYYAAFIGCSSETEASVETMAFLANKVVELQLDVILIIEGSDSKIADTVKSTAIQDDSTREDVQILTLDSMQSVNAKTISDDYSYLSAMESNLQVIISAIA